MVDAMTARHGRPINRTRHRAATRPLRRVLALLVAGTFIAAGCAPATGQSAGTSTGIPSGIAGEAVARVCGGAASGDQGCRRHPVAATIVVIRVASRHRIATVHSDHRGRFRLDLPPGRYELQAHAPSALTWARAVVTRVRAHHITPVTITFVPRHPLPVTPAASSG